MKSKIVLRTDNKVDLLLVRFHFINVIIHGDHFDCAGVFCVVAIKTEQGIFVVVVSEQPVLYEELEVRVPLLVLLGIPLGLVVDKLENTTCQYVSEL